MAEAPAVVLRKLERLHLDNTRAWANDPELMALLDRARPVTEAEHERWFASLADRTNAVYFAVETSEGSYHIGNVWLWDIDPRHRRAEVRIVLGDRTRLGKGFGTQVLELVSDFAFRRLNLHKIYAYVLSINPRARRAFEKAGFSLEGTLVSDRWFEDRFIDVFLLGRIAASELSQPDRPQ